MLRDARKVEKKYCDRMTVTGQVIKVETSDYGCKQRIIWGLKSILCQGVQCDVWRVDKKYCACTAIRAWLRKGEED